MGDNPRQDNGTPLESTANLLELTRQGDSAARERLVARYLPILRQWAHGRLPASTRDIIDTDDLVQVTLIRALNHVGRFEPRHEGAFLAYLRTILLNGIRDEIRKHRRQPGRAELSEDLPDGLPSPLAMAIGSETARRYERALSGLPRQYQEAILLRIEFQFTYEAMAEALGRPSPNAARLLVARALLRLASEMHERP
jgi:RNA polymerase sigma-70 factor (ECF subfamily)